MQSKSDNSAQVYVSYEVFEGEREKNRLLMQAMGNNHEVNRRAVK